MLNRINWELVGWIALMGAVGYVYVVLYVVLWMFFYILFSLALK